MTPARKAALEIYTPAQPTQTQRKLAQEIADTLYPDNASRNYVAFNAALAGMKLATEMGAQLVDNLNATGPYDAIMAARRMRRGEHLELAL